MSWGPGWWDRYATGAATPPDDGAIALAARALAVFDGDGRAYDEDPDAREGFAERARVAVGIYLEQVGE